MINTKSNEKGFYEFKLNPGTYQIKVSKKGFQDFEDTIVIKGETTFDIDLSKTNNQGLNKDCKANNCYYLTVYFLDTGMKVNHSTYAVEAGTVVSSSMMVDAINKVFGSDFISSDGENFYLGLGDIKLDFAWYYKDTEEKFNWNIPIDRDIEIEMKLLNGFIDNEMINDIKNFFNG